MNLRYTACSLFHILCHDLSESIEKNDSMPFGFFLLLAYVLVLPSLTGGKCDIDNHSATGELLLFGINQNHSFYAAHSYLVVVIGNECSCYHPRNLLTSILFF